YLVETTTGKLGVYSMVQSETTTPGMTDRILIRRHDMVNIRTNATPPPVDVQNLTRPIQPLAPMPGSVPQQPVLPNIPAMQPPIIPQPNNGLQPTGGVLPGNQ
ncbi:MAG TPA: hypothetical protein PKA06_08465, partial [Gemmatales bacterium]|nr:hypothetical protein [Gemmatales bacterium]